MLVEPEGSIYGGNPPGPKKIEGIGQTQFLPKIYDASLADEVLMVMNDEVCAAFRRLARTEGVLGGWSSAAAAAGAYRIAERLGAGKKVVTVFPDGAERTKPGNLGRLRSAIRDCIFESRLVITIKQKIPVAGGYTYWQSQSAI